jgi:hypothetical protein
MLSLSHQACLLSNSLCHASVFRPLACACSAPVSNIAFTLLAVGVGIGIDSHLADPNTSVMPAMGSDLIRQRVCSEPVVCLRPPSVVFGYFAVSSLTVAPQLFDAPL